MTANTPLYGWPYPTAPDRLDITLTDTIKNGLLAVEGTLSGWGGIANPGAWHTVGAAGEPAFTAGFDSFPGFQAVQFRKVGNQVFMRGLLRRPGAASPATTTVFTLPAGYRPLASQLYGTHISGAEARLDVQADGQVVLQTAAATGAFISMNIPAWWLD
jgi:hypothetical protein